MDPLTVAADKKKRSSMVMINQVFPVKRQVPLEGLYLDQRLQDKAAEIGRSLVLTDFLTDKNGVVATAAKDGHFEISAALKNSSDWGRYQELLAQANVFISGGSYFKRLETSQDILYQFEPGHAFENLGQWRLNAGYQKRSPDVAIVTRELDFEIPEKLIQSGRRIVIFTTDSIAKSDKARSLSNVNTLIIGRGEGEVEGERMIATLANDMGYRVIMMVSGPHILDLLLKAERMDLIYVTEAQVEISFEDRSTVQTILLGGKKVSDLKDFNLAHQFIQENVVTEDASLLSQSFLRYDRKDLKD
jgi:riboflavin biosynthesis pyrimidine reductase